jgi:hypothetical protein
MSYLKNRHEFNGLEPIPELSEELFVGVAIPPAEAESGKPRATNPTERGSKPSHPGGNPGKRAAPGEVIWLEA